MSRHDKKSDREEIVKMDKTEARTKYQSSDEWRNFASRAQKNPFMKAFLISYAQNGTCPYCGKRFTKDDLKNVQGHHKDYDHVCVTMETIRLSHPTSKRPNREVKCPDCQKCASVTADKFIECAKRIEFLHAGCHMQKHGLTMKYRIA